MQTNKTRTARIGAVVLASCLGAGAVLAASPAMALDGFASKSFYFNAGVSLQKTDSESGELLDGAIFRVAAANNSAVFIGAFGAYDHVDPATWGLLSTLDHAELTWEEYLDSEIERHNDKIRPYFDEIAVLLESVLDPDQIATHEATVALHDAALAAHQPFADAISQANATRQALADEILALQAAGEPIPAELALAHADAQQAQSDAIAAGQPTADALAAIAPDAAIAHSALTAHAAAQSELELRFPEGWEIWDAEYGHGVDQNAFEATMTEWRNENAPRVQRALAQAECNAQFGLPTTPVATQVGEFGGTEYVYELAVCDGVASLPVGSVPRTIQEIVAPDGYVLDSTVYTVTQTGETTLEWKGERQSTRDAVLDITNERVEEPPVEPTDPPVEPEEPVVPEVPVTPETPTLAQTGADGSSAVALGGIAALLAATGGALAFRRRIAE